MIKMAETATNNVGTAAPGCPIERSSKLFLAVIILLNKISEVLSKICNPDPSTAVTRYSITQLPNYPITKFHRSLQKNSTYPCPPARPRRKIPPSSPAKSGRPRSPSCRDQDYADYFSSCHTTPPLAAGFRLSTIVAPPAYNSTASENDSSPAAASPRCRHHAQYRIQNASRADACAETYSAKWHHLAASPPPRLGNSPLLEESSMHDYSTEE